MNRASNHIDNTTPPADMAVSVPVAEALAVTQLMPVPVMNHEHQATITRVIAHAGQLLQAYNAESRIIEQTTERLGMAFGVDSVDIALTAKAIILTTRCGDHCITTTRTMKMHGIDMGIVCEVQRICILAEKKLYDLAMVKRSLTQLRIRKYPPLLVAFFVALSCACFSHLFGGDHISEKIGRAHV